MTSRDRLHQQTTTLLTAKLKRGARTHGATTKQRWALDLALDLMEQFGLIAAGWHCAFSTTSKRGLGQARIQTIDGIKHKVIYLSTSHLDHDGADEIEDTIRHEIAHALDYERHGSMDGHGTRWRAIAVEVGAKPERTMRATAADDRGYVWVLTYRGQTIRGYYRFPRSVARNLPHIGLQNQPETRGQLKLVKMVR